MIGTQLGHYRLISLLGEGGMGRVFAAEDTRLGRRVALKLLADALASVPAHVVRFQREARLLAAVNHPNIATVHSVEEVDGKPFFTMEYIEGETLQERVRPGGLAWNQLLAIARPLAEGLGAAHAHGIVHRDLKPANVMINRDGHLKIVDFGLARPERNAVNQAVLTDAGTVLGTPAYMAPEQLRGEAVDQRTDLFSYAVLLYELATGKRPFAGASAMEIVSAILRDEPRPLAWWCLDMPAGLQELLDGCLQKDPAQRTASAAAVLERLAALTTPGASESVTPPPAAARAVSALAVLPLQEIGAGIEDLLADGVTEALIANLARASELKVISRSSSMRFKGSTDPLQEIARRLGVDALVCGSVRRSGNRIRISVELVDPASDRVLWAEHYDRELEDVLKLQDEISHAIAAGVEARIGSGHTSGPGAETRAAAPQRVDPEVYFLDLKGRSQVEQRTEASFRAALALFRQALARNPDYAPAHIGVARAYNMLMNYGIVGFAEALPQIDAALDRARALRADPAELLGEQAHKRWQIDFDWYGADADLRQALKLAPSNTRLWHWRAFVQATAGNCDLGLECLAHALTLDPLSWWFPAARGFVLYLGRRMSESVAQLRQVIANSPDSSAPYWLIGMALAASGEYIEAISNFETAILRFGRISRLLGYLGRACALAGQETRARALLDELRQRAATGYVPEYFFALIHTGLGENEAALEWLERALARRDSMLRDLRADASFEALHEEPRFRAILTALNFPPVPVAAMASEPSIRTTLAGIE